MISDPTLFYDFYLSDYHAAKAKYLKYILENLAKVEADVFKNALKEKERDQFRLTVKSDLRQTYFHAIETFFEIFFALNPKNKTHYDDESLMFNLTNSNWGQNYKKIAEIADGTYSLDFLSDEIQVGSYKVSIGNYIFYMGLFDKNKYPTLENDIQGSIEAVQYGMKILAKDFVQREEYNAYKHGLRIIPAFKKLMLADLKTLEVKHEWDLTDSMSFYTPTKNPDVITSVTKLFDSERDFQMTLFCSNLISHMIFYRKIAMNKDKQKDGDKQKDQIAVTFFGKEPIEKCNQVNVKIQDIVHTITRIKK